MPTIWIQDGFRFFFFSNEHEPLHVHIEKGDSAAKFNLIPVALVKNEGMKSKDLKKAEAIIVERQQEFITKWKSYFN
ncbi:DUF4160 domain-containing protein [Larkinella knui]|uniref:DUF4160 domain-containing protein n=1 Tax=Larkinella knui TaxID=2025310 RepID=A0A3P1CCB5_9BACT|nr:DUF4160 domain-containing protein [Larkinella knui]RRB10898.1 DUF4160 domain-containing protein [Larkinella knui]